MDFGPRNEREYLKRLRGPNGELVRFHRLGSCCPFESKNGFMGNGLLDRYEVQIDGKSTTRILYLNMYNSGRYYAPEGFTFIKHSGTWGN